jgi:hypothetical protein
VVSCVYSFWLLYCLDAKKHRNLSRATPIFLLPHPAELTPHTIRCQSTYIHLYYTLNTGIKWGVHVSLIITDIFSVTVDEERYFQLIPQSEPCIMDSQDTHTSMMMIFFSVCCVCVCVFQIFFTLSQSCLTMYPNYLVEN